MHRLTEESRLMIDNVLSQCVRRLDPKGTFTTKEGISRQISGCLEKNPEAKHLLLYILLPNKGPLWFSISSFTVEIA